MYKEERREKQGREGGILFLHLTCFPDEFFNDQIQSTVKTSQGERNPQRMNQKRNDLGNVFLFRGKKTGFNFALPLLLFTNYEDFPATAWRGSGRAVTLSQARAQGDEVCVKHVSLGGLPDCITSNVCLLLPLLTSTTILGSTGRRLA